MQVIHVARTAAFVQIVHTPGTEKEAVADFLFQLGECIVGGVGLAGAAFSSALRVELPDEFEVRIPAFGGGHRLHPVASPPSVAIAEGF